MNILLDKNYCLKNLNELNNGIYKHWIWGSELKYHSGCDYLQKINYSIQALNIALEKGLSPCAKDVIYVIVLVDWIKEAFGSIQTSLNKGLIDEFSYLHEQELDNAKNYFIALRSFVVAHPLNTTRHSKFGLTGEKICIDIADTQHYMFTKDSDWYHLDMTGMNEDCKQVPCDFVLYIYDSQYTCRKLYKYIGCDFADIFKVAELYIDKLYKLSTYLSKQKKKDWT